MSETGVTRRRGRATLRRDVTESAAMIEPDERLWNAICERDAAFEGALFYGVVTTGIYCRPGCPARRPKRENVRFFLDARSAERAGLRPCKRCAPQRSASPDVNAHLVMRTCARAASLEPLPAPGQLAIDAGVGERTLRRAFHELLGMTPGQYLQGLKAQRLRAALRDGGRVTDAIYSAGYGSSGRAYENTGRLGMQPSAYAGRGAGARIEYTLRRTRLGWLLAAATPRGVCCARFGESRRELLAGFEAEYAAADRVASANDWIEALFEFADQRTDWRVLPVDVRGTAFQERVWRALRDIPAGETRTYADVARAIGLPSAVRAVASACAANPVALAVPCHRVVPKAGGVGGYRWGAARKRAVLTMERRG